MSAPHPSGSKDVLRRSARLLRGDLPATGGAALAAHLMSYLDARLPAVVGGYWPIGSEFDIRPALAALRARGAEIALPEATPQGNPLIFKLWRPGADLLAGRFGTSSPDGPPVIPDMLLVPLLAFDRRGHRLGYGGGYYDRTLAAWPHLHAVGCAYAAQELDAAPAGPYDRRLNAIVTELGVIEIEI